MYVNIEVYKNSGLEFSDLIFLAGIKQTETEWLIETLPDSVYQRFVEQGLVIHIKSRKKDDHAYKSLRLSEKGKKLISELEEAPIEEQDKTVGEWLCKYYLDAGKEIGNKKKTFRHIRDFRIKSGVEKNNLIKLCVDFLKENEDKSNKLEFIFFHPKNIFEVKFELDGSWLYQYYLKNKERLDNTFEEY